MGFTRFFFEYGRALGDADMEMIWDEHCHTQLTMRCELARLARSEPITRYAFKSVHCPPADCSPRRLFPPPTVPLFILTVPALALGALPAWRAASHSFSHFLAPSPTFSSLTFPQVRSRRGAQLLRPLKAHQQHQLQHEPRLLYVP